MKLVVCSSAAFYKHVLELKEQLETLGLEVVVPKSAHTMLANNDFDTANTKTWYNNPEDYSVKADLMRSHFDEITNGDAILVVNDDKHGVPGYIGPNVLMEMSLAWYQQKPIYILNDLPENSPFEEELKGMMPIILKGNLGTLGDNRA
jgi:hypothetical protein